MALRFSPCRDLAGVLPAFPNLILHPLLGRESGRKIPAWRDLLRLYYWIAFIAQLLSAPAQRPSRTRP